MLGSIDLVFVWVAETDRTFGSVLGSGSGLLYPLLALPIEQVSVGTHTC